MRRDINAYLHGMDEKNLSREYIRSTRQVLLRFQEHCAGFGICASSRVGTDQIRDFMDRYQVLSGAYRRFTWSVVKCFLADTGNSAALTFKLRISGSCRERVDWLFPEEIEQILSTPMTLREAVQIRSGLLQGLRKIEVVRMTVKDATNALSSRVLTVHGKAGKIRSIPIHQGLAQALEAYLRDCPYDSNMSLLGIGKNQAATTVVNFSLRFGRRFTSHTLRRSFGRGMWLKGVDLVTISELMGHSTVDMTRRYLGLNLSDMRKAIDQYGTKSEMTIISELPARRVGRPRLRETDEPLNIDIFKASGAHAHRCASSDSSNSVGNLINQSLGVP